MRDINLLPKDKRFSYKQYLIKKVIILSFIFDLIFIMLLFGVNIYLNGKLNKCITKRKIYLNKILAVDSKLDQYNNKYKKLLKKLSELKKEEERLKSLIFIRRSAFSSTIICLNTFTKGVKFENLSYENGWFMLNGQANSLKNFQIFYHSLEKNNFLINLKLYSLKKKEKVYEFKISYGVEF